MLKINIDFKIRNLIFDLIRDLFLGSFILLAIFSAMEVIKPRIVLNYINLDLWLLTVIILGVVTIFYYQPESDGNIKLQFWSKLTVILISIIIGIACVYLTKSIGYLSILTGLALTIISYYLIILCLEE